MNVDEPRADADPAPAPVPLDSLDDTALRAIAYGRTADDHDRMRARTASMILANRHASVMRGPRDAHDGLGVDGLAAVASRQVRTGVIEGSLDVDSDESDDSRRPTPRHRVVLIGAVSAALLAGGIIGATAGEIGEALQPDSLDIFDRPADDESVTSASSFGLGSGEVRLLAELGAVQIFGTKSDTGLFVADGELGTQICLTATTEETGVQFFPFNCVPEQVFREQGLRGVLPAIDSSSGTVVRTLAFQWGPRGGLNLEDISPDILTTTIDRFSEQDLLQGLDIPLVQVIRDQEPDPAIARELPGTLFGPVDIGTVSAGAGVTARMWGSIFPDSDGSDGVAVCLSAEVQGNLVAHECASMAAFRTVGVDVSFDRADALVTVSVGPSGAVSAVIEE